jgi:thiamine-monophosphate kinase
MLAPEALYERLQANAEDLRLRELGEKRLLAEYLQPLCRAVCGDAGIGDDTGVLTITPGHEVLVSSDRIPTDLLARQFNLMPTETLGRYIVRVNVSDIAAMVGTPVAIVLSLAFPADTRLRYLLELMWGAYNESVAWGCPVVGGDTKAAAEECLSATVIGEAPIGRAVRRGPVSVGDSVFVTGTVGSAGAALRWFSQTLTDPSRSTPDPGTEASLKAAILAPTPRLDLVSSLRATDGLVASMDVTDGLGQSLVEIAEPGGLGIEVESDRIPFSGEALWVASALECDPIAFVGGIGNDLQLVLVARPDTQAPAGATRIGVVTEAGGVRLKTSDGRVRDFPISGFEHFSRPPAAFLGSA